MTQDFGLLLLRLGFGGFMLFGHGLDKLMNFSTKAQFFPDIFGLGSSFSLGLAVFAEFFCCLALMIGIRARWAAIPPLITMLVAGFIIHADDPWGKKELALLYAIGFLAITLLDGGRYCIRFGKN